MFSFGVDRVNPKSKSNSKWKAWHQEGSSAWA